MHSSTAVFVGPTLSPDDVRKILPSALLKPPAKHGSVYELVGKGVENILIIDGYFYSTPSLWHREILMAIDSGISVYGSSSLGALRAAELTRYGMKGIGWVYERYLDESIDGDDEVSVLHQNEQCGYTQLTIPLVNLRYNLNCACRKGVINSREVDIIINNLKSKPFYLRFPELLSIEGMSIINASVSGGSASCFLRDNWIDIKASDARAALQAIKIANCEKIPFDPYSLKWQLTPDYVISGINKYVQNIQPNVSFISDNSDNALATAAGVVCGILHLSFNVPSNSLNRARQHDALLGTVYSTNAREMLAKLINLIDDLASVINMPRNLRICLPNVWLGNSIEVNLLLLLLLGSQLELNQCDPSAMEEKAILESISSLELNCHGIHLGLLAKLIKGVWFCQKSPDYFGLTSWRDPIFSNVAELFSNKSEGDSL